MNFWLYFVICVINASTSEQIGLPEDVDDIKDAMVGVAKRIHSPECVIVLLYDDLMPETGEKSNLLSALQNGERVFLTLDLSSDQLPELNMTYQTTSTSAIMAKYLHVLYRMSRCYTFLIWLTDPSVLYPNDVNLHPGWRDEDVVVFAAHHITQGYKDLIQQRFWREIPNLLGLKRTGSRGRTVNVFTVLPYFTNGRPKSHEIDVWLIGERAFQKNVPLVWDKFTSFNGAQLKVTFVWKAPFLIVGDAEMPYLDGLDWRLMGLVKRRLGFNMKLISSLGTGRLQDGTWTGAMGQIEMGAADVGMGGISVTPTRRTVFHFCRTYYTDSFAFISPLIKGKSGVWAVLFKPFELEVWIAVGVAAVAVTISMKILASWEQHMVVKVRGDPSFGDRWFTSISHNLLHLLNIFCQRSFNHVPSSRALRSAYITTSFSITLVGIAFGGCLFAQLLKPNPDMSIDKIREIRKSGLPVDVRDYDGYLNEFVNGSTRRGLKRIWNNANFVNWSDAFVSIDEVVKGNRIYIDSRARLNFVGRQKYMGSVGLKFHLASENIIHGTNIAWVTRNKWPFRKKVDRIIIAAVESGLVQYWMSHFRMGNFGWDDEAMRLSFPLSKREQRAKNFDPTHDSRDTGIKPLNMSQLDGINSLWLLGMFMAICIFIGELILGYSSLRFRKFKRSIDRLRAWRVLQSRKELLALKMEMCLEVTAKRFRKKGRVNKKTAARSDAQKPPCQPIVWSDFGNTIKWISASQVSVQAPGLISRKNAGKVSKI